MNVLLDILFWFSIILITIGTGFLTTWYLNDNESYDIYKRSHYNKSLSDKSFYYLISGITLIIVGNTLLFLYHIKYHNNIQKNN